MSLHTFAPEAIYHPDASRGDELAVDEAFLIVNEYAGPLLETMACVDPDTLKHELGVGQLAAQMLLPALLEKRFTLSGADEDYRVVAAVCGGLHDTGKYRPDIQTQLGRGDFGRETREWVRAAHCGEGEWQIYLYQQLGEVPPSRLPVLDMARSVAANHHSTLPPEYWRLPRDQAIASGLTHLVKYCDVLHALWYDQSARRGYQEGRDGLTRDRSPEVVLALIHQECGYENPIIDGVEIDMETELRKHLGLS